MHVDQSSETEYRRPLCWSRRIRDLIYVLLKVQRKNYGLHSNRENDRELECSRRSGRQNKLRSRISTECPMLPMNRVIFTNSVHSESEWSGIACISTYCNLSGGCLVSVRVKKKPRNSEVDTSSPWIMSSKMFTRFKTSNKKNSPWLKRGGMHLGTSSILMWKTGPGDFFLEILVSKCCSSRDGACRVVFSIQKCDSSTSSKPRSKWNLSSRGRAQTLLRRDFFLTPSPNYRLATNPEMMVHDGRNRLVPWTVIRVPALPTIVSKPYAQTEGQWLWWRLAQPTITIS